MAEQAPKQLFLSRAYVFDRFIDYTLNTEERVWKKSGPRAKIKISIKTVEFILDNRNIVLSAN